MLDGELAGPLDRGHGGRQHEVVSDGLDRMLVVRSTIYLSLVGIGVVAVVFRGRDVRVVQGKVGMQVWNTYEKMLKS